MRILWRILKHLKRYLLRAVLACVCLLEVNAFQFGVSWIIKWVVELGLAGASLTGSASHQTAHNDWLIWPREQEELTETRAGFEGDGYEEFDDIEHIMRERP